MSDRSTTAVPPRRKGWSRLGRVARPVILVLFVISFLGVSEVFSHVALGWTAHLRATAPSLLPRWTDLLLPLACLALASWLVHRFIRWWLAAKGSTVDWRARHTVASTAMVLLGAAAAIALSGVVHQLAWLSNEPMHERRGADFARADAMNSAIQILFALEEFHLDHDHYPDTLADLSLPPRVTMVRPVSGGAPEPFVYFKPATAPDPDAVVLVSPILRQREVVITGYLPRNTEVHPATGLADILETRRKPVPKSGE